jgi:phosphatidate phosphatase LPIN
VDIAVNGRIVPFNMKIGEAGEAFFVFETDADVPDELITSPLLEPTQPNLPDSLPPGDISDDAVDQEPEFLDLDAPSSGLRIVSEGRDNTGLLPSANDVLIKV